MNKVVFITNRLPFPKTDGRKNILMQYIEQIKKIYPGCKIINLSFVDDKNYLKDRPVVIDELILLEHPSIIGKLSNSLLNTFFTKKWPLQVSMYYSKSTYKKIMTFIDRENPDYVFYDMVRVAEYIPVSKRANIKTILNYDDLLSLRYKRQIEWIDYIPSIFGGLSNMLNGRIRKILELKWLQKAILTFEGNLLQKYEIEQAKNFDHLIFTSPKEALDFKDITIHPSCIGIPMVVNPERNNGKRKYNSSKIVFVGKMDIPHNVSAVIYFLDKIWPLVKNENQNAEFYIIGKSPTEKIISLSKEHANVIVTGPVDDIKESISDAAVFIAPLVFGTGIKTKVIEAMSMGVPVVSTTIGAEGIVYENKKEMFVVDHEHDFSRYILDLMENAELNQTTSNLGLDLVRNYFSDKNNLEKWQRIFS